MKKFISLMISALLCLSFCSCSSAPVYKTVYAMDTAATITAYGENAEEGIDAAEKEIYRLDALMSRSGEKSDIYMLNTAASGEVSDETAFVIKTALDMCRETSGAFDITVAPLMDAWGFFGHDYRVPDDSEIDGILERVDYKNVVLSGNSVELRADAEIDLGGIAKGYASSAAANALIESGVSSALISFGSTIQAIGKKPDGEDWSIAITDPQNPEEYIATLKLSDICISTSGSYEQVFEENGISYHHIIDPFTGRPAISSLASVSVISDDPTTADALSTALFVMGFEKAVEYQKKKGGFEAVFITDENEVYYTKGLSGKIDAGIEL